MTPLSNSTDPSSGLRCRLSNALSDRIHMKKKWIHMIIVMNTDADRRRIKWDNDYFTKNEEDNVEKITSVRLCSRLLSVANDNKQQRLQQLQRRRNGWGEKKFLSRPALLSPPLLFLLPPSSFRLKSQKPREPPCGDSDTKT